MSANFGANTVRGVRLQNRTSTSPHNHSRRCERVCSSSKVLAVAMADNSSAKEWLKRFIRHGGRDSAKSKKEDGAVSSANSSQGIAHDEALHFSS
jgi:hypothetical protein